MLRNIVIWSLFISLFGGHVSAENQQGVGRTDQLWKFAVVALSKEHNTRRDFENELVKNLRANNYDVVTSHSLLPDIISLRDSVLRLKLQEEEIQGVLLIDIGKQASIQSVQKQIEPRVYDSIEAFVRDYRGGDFSTQAVVQVSGFLLSELVLSNLNASKGYLRKRLGFQALNAD